MRVEDSYFLLSKLATKLQSSRLCGTGMRKDIQINGRELRVQKKTHIYGQLIFIKDAETIPWGKE